MASGEELPASAGDARDVGLIPESGRSPEGGNGNPFQYSCLENPTDRGAWWAIVHEVQRVRHNLSDLAQSTVLETIGLICLDKHHKNLVEFTT